MKRSLLAAGLLLLSMTLPAHAALIGVNWAVDSVPDGLGSGTLGSLGVSLVSTNGNVNGGTTFTADWPGRAGTNDVPGIAALAGANRNAIDGVGGGTPGFARITFTGGTVTNPILLFDFTEGIERFDFADGLTLTLLDHSPAGSVVIAANNVVEVNGLASNQADDSFALQLTGTFSVISFDTLLSSTSAESVGFSIAADAANVVPAPGSLALVALGLAGLGRIRRRRA